MTDYIDPMDKVDAMVWAINRLKHTAPQGGFDQLDRNRLHLLELLREDAQREARR